MVSVLPASEKLGVICAFAYWHARETPPAPANAHVCLLLVVTIDVAQPPVEAATALSEQLIARVRASLERRVSKEAEFEGEGTWDEEDADLLQEEIAPEEVCLRACVLALADRGYLWETGNLVCNRERIVQW